MPSFVGLFDEDLIAVSLLPFFDPTMLVQMLMVNCADRIVIAKYRTQIPYAVLLVKRAKGFMVDCLRKQHLTCSGWTPDSLTAKLVEHVGKFMALVTGPRQALSTRERVVKALKHASPIDDSATECWQWKPIIRLLLPVAASYGGSWPDASFAVEICARLMKSKELLALFAPDPCNALEALAVESKDEIGASIAAVLGSMIRTSTATTAPIMLPLIEALTSKALIRAKTRADVTFVVACMSLAERIRIMSEAPDLVGKSKLPGVIFSSISVRKSTRTQYLEIDLYMRLLGIDYDTRLRPHLEQTFECKGHPSPPRRVANVMQHMFSGPAFTVAGHPLDEYTGSTARLFAALAGPAGSPPWLPLMTATSGALPTAARPVPDDMTDEADLDPPTETPPTRRAAPGGTNGAEGANDAPREEDAEEDDENDENDEDDYGVFGHTAIAPEDIAAMVNDIATQTGVDPTSLFGNFLRQDAGVIDEGNDADDAENAAGDGDDGDDVPDLEISDHGQISGAVQTMADVSRVLGQFVGQMHAAASRQSAATSSLESDDDTDEPSS